MEEKDEITRAALEAGLDETWGMSEAQFHDALRRYDAIRFKELHERVAELEQFKSDVLAAVPMSEGCRPDSPGWIKVYIEELPASRAEAFSTTQEALKESERVRGMLAEQLGRAVNTFADQAHYMAKDEDIEAALAASQALDKKEMK